jgi:hypothetical protein
MAKSQSGGFDKILANIWEKIVLGVAIIVTLGLIALSAGGGPKVDVTPEQLTQLASRAEQNYKATPPDVIKENETFAAPRYSEVAKRIREAVSSTGYQIVAPFDPPMFEQRKKRGQPPVFPVSDLRAAAGHGAVAGLGDTSVGVTGTGTAYPTGTPYPTGSASPGYPGGSPTMPSPEYGMSETGYPGYAGYGGYGGPTGPSHGRRWVVVTGIIEWEKQIRAFRDTFQDAIRVAGQGTAGMTGAVGYPGYATTGEESYTGYPGAMGSPTGTSEYGYGPTGISNVEFPRFVYFSIERAEITDLSAPVDNLKWEPLNARARWFEEQRIPHDQFMYVSPEYVMPPGQVPLTWPLVQLTAGDTWGKEVAHDPEIPFFEIPRGMGYGYGPYASAEGYPGAGYPTMSGMPGPGAGMPTGLIRTSGTTGGQTGQTTQQTQPPRPEIPDSPIAPGQMVPGMPGASPYGVPSYGMETMPEGSYTSPYGGAGYPGSYPTPTGEEGYGSGYGYPGYGTGMVVRKESPTKLFRFVDYKVEPGKTYRYRVKLWLANPNYKLPPQVLEDEAFSREAWLLTDWSTPSNPVRVPADIGVLAGPAKAGRVAFIEPRVTLGVTVFQPTSGLTKFMEFADLPRGTIVDFTAADVKRLNPPKREKKPTTPSPYGYTGEEGMPSPEYGAEGIPGKMGSPGSGPPPGYPGYPGASTAVTKPAEEPEIDYLSRMMIVDLAGGEQLPTKDSAPSVVALMDPEGNLMVRDELEDAPQYNRFTKPAQPTGMYSDYSPEMMYSEEGYSGYYGETMPGGTRPTDRRRGTTTTRGRTTTPGRNAPRGGQTGSPPMMGP